MSALTDMPVTTVGREVSDGCLASLHLTPVILTYNEEPNIGRLLDRLRWARRIIVVDSLSSDRTRAICDATSNVEVFERPFDSHADQWNYALRNTGVDTEWVLALDADYVPTHDFLNALPEALARDIAGFRCRFRYVSLGRRLRASLYPPVVCLYRTKLARYVQDGHTQRVVVEGLLADLDAPLDHDDRKPLQRWFASQQRYAALEAAHLLAADPGCLGPADRLRLVAGPAPFAVLLYALLVKGCLLEGVPGWFYAMQRVLAEIMLALEIISRRREARAMERRDPLGT